MSYSTDLGYGIRVVEMHFYDKKKAVEYAAQLIHREAEVQRT